MGGGRLALVVGSECAALATLEFPGQLAIELHSRLGGLGGWQDATSLPGPLLNPTAAELAAAVDEAFAAASRQRATLLISFVGHGTATGAEDFYLLARDSPVLPNSGTAFHLTQGIRERLNTAAVDGLIVLVDACDTGQGVQGAARRWSELLARSQGRMELLVAAGEGPAFAGCFTRTMVTAFDTGLGLRGENLLPSDLVDPIVGACTRQQPQHLSFTAGAETSASGGDPGLWLVPNIARRRDAVSGRPAAGFVDQLTRTLMLTDTIRERLTEILETSRQRLRVVAGPPGCGKSTLMAMLIRPGLVEGLTIAPEYITAAIFLTVASSLESVAAELSTQLGNRVPGFTAAARAARELAEHTGSPLDVFDIEIRQPLARVAKPGDRVTIVFDGLDQPEQGSRDLLVHAVSMLTRDAEFSHVRVIAGIREGTGVEDLPALAHMCRIDLREPTAAEIAAMVRKPTRAEHERLDPAKWINWIDALLAQIPTTIEGERAVAGGWLVARLLIDVNGQQVAEGVGLDTLVAHRVRDGVVSTGPDSGGAVGRLLGILVAAGAGPVLPLELLEFALSSLGVSWTTARVRDVTVGLGVLLSRSRPGRTRESLGITHNALIPALQAESQRLGAHAEQAHRAIIAAIQNITTDQALDYARGSAVRHYLAYGDSTAAVLFLRSLDTPRAADNRDRWGAWLPSFTDTVGPDHPATLTTRGHLANWRGHSGDLDGAVTEFEVLLTDYLRVLGPDHPDTLTTRGNLARWRAQSGDLDGAVTEFEVLLTDRLRVLGPDHPHTLTTRHNLVHWRAQSGDLDGAVTEFEVLLTDRLRVLGPDHPDTLTTRHNLAYWRAQSGDLDGAVTEFEVLLTDYLRVLGPDHPDTLTTRGNLANWRGHSGDLDGAVTEFEVLLTDHLRVLGPDHPATLTTRHNLAHWRAQSGDPAGAVTELEGLLTDRLRVLGPDHPATLTTRHNLAHSRAESGDRAGTVTELEGLLTDYLRVLGPDHPATLTTRHNLAHSRAENGDPAGTVTELEGLLTDYLRVLGPDHPDTLTIRHDLAYWRGVTGGAADAATAG
ncbi:tetratricopeptide repeat protein [Nocardia vinacea]|uniref:tetratricopeptide repeat protein n=1 Tax=Nocardia vinacea TaxID=96468 RepID=UPI002E14BC42|nr:tetratricopeptide repeat protein [Nocardia vinacea]